MSKPYPSLLLYNIQFGADKIGKIVIFKATLNTKNGEYIYSRLFVHAPLATYSISANVCNYCMCTILYEYQTNQALEHSFIHPLTTEFAAVTLLQSGILVS